MGINNPQSEVLKLQRFLLDKGYDVIINGSFDLATDSAVRQFQLDYRETILAPWANLGLGNSNTATGYVYKTTQWQINEIMCPGFRPFPDLP